MTDRKSLATLATAIATDGVTCTGNGTTDDPVTVIGGGGGGVVDGVSIIGAGTLVSPWHTASDKTAVAVDGTSITGDGTTGNPLVATGGGGATPFPSFTTIVKAVAGDDATYALTAQALTWLDCSQASIGITAQLPVANTVPAGQGVALVVLAGNTNSPDLTARWMGAPLNESDPSGEVVIITAGSDTINGTIPGDMILSCATTGGFLYAISDNVSSWTVISTNFTSYSSTAVSVDSALFDYVLTGVIPTMLHLSTPGAGNALRSLPYLTGRAHVCYLFNDDALNSIKLLNDNESGLPAGQATIKTLVGDKTLAPGQGAVLRYEFDPSVGNFFWWCVS